MTALIEIPIFPLGGVLYPAGRLPLRIFEPRYVEMTQSCIRQNKVFGVTLIRAGYEVGKPAIPCDVGCTARISEWQLLPSGQYVLLTQGESVFRIIEHWSTPSGLIVARVEFAEPPDPISVPERYHDLVTLLRELIEGIGPESFPKVHRLGDAAWVGNRLAELLPIKPERKQKLLESSDDPLAVLAELEQMIRELRE